MIAVRSWKVVVLVSAALILSFSFVEHTRAAIGFVTSTQATYTCCDATVNVTSTAVNTTGASLLVILAHSNITTSTFTVTDSYGNTWNGLGWAGDGGGGGFSQIYYAYNPTVGPNHTFHLHTGVADGEYIRGVMQAYSGTVTSSAVYDPGSATATVNDNATSTYTGTSTPSQMNDLFVTQWNTDRGGGTSGTITNGFTIDQSIFGAGAAQMQSAYLISTTALVQDPLWSQNNPSTGMVASIAAFEAATSSFPLINSFSASPSFVLSAGTSTLSWNVSNASSVAITPDSGFSTSALVASTTTNPTSTTVFTLTATNANGTSTATTTVTVDATSPTTPTSVVTTILSSSSISLGWASSTDVSGPGVAGYNIFRCMGSSCTPISRIATSSGAFYTDSGLTASTTYTYAVSAYDTLGLVSATSSNASGTTDISDHLYTVKAGGGGNFTTIQACANALSNGDTCIVYAGTYNEHVTLSAGGVGAYRTLEANGSDTVSVYDFTINSHDKIVGFHIQNPSSPSSNDCIGIVNSSTDIYITNNNFYACGLHAMISGVNASDINSYVYIEDNTLSYPCSTASAPNECEAMNILGDHHLVENNDISHASDAINYAGSYNVFRNNTFYDASSSECGSNSSNCHIDFMQTEPLSSAQYNIYEANTELYNLGSNGHGYLSQGDVCDGQCHNLIIRFNVGAHVGSGGIFDDNAENSSTPGFSYVKSYNNDWIDFNNDPGNQLYGGTNAFTNNSTNGSEINDLFYYPESLASFNPYVTDSSTFPTFSIANNLAYCTASPCNLYGHVYSGGGSFASDPGNIEVDPQFVDYATNDFLLSSSSPAIGAGTYLTTVSSTDSGSGTSLVVTDASYFQDGFGLTDVQPDWIAVGSATNTTQIVSINYSTNVITLATSLTRTSGTGVYLYKDSSGNQVLFNNDPDIGAHQYTDIPTISSFYASPTIITSGSGITLSWVTMNASSVSLSGDSLSLSTTTLSGSISVTPVTTGSLIYTVIATNANGTSTATTMLTVNAASSGGGGGGGGCGCGGGGGGGYIPPASTTSSSTASSSTSIVIPTSTAGEEALLTDLEGELQSLLAQAAREGITVQGTSSYVFTQNISLGMRSSDAEELQHYLNTHGFPVVSTTTYAGSLGYETKYFGPSTKAALEKFQAAHGIPATGYFGAITRAYVNGHE